MATIFDFTSDDPTFARFLEEREAERVQAQERLENHARTLQERLAAARQLERDLYTEMVGESFSLQTRFNARSVARRRRLEAEKTAHNDYHHAEHYFRNWNITNPTGARMQDQRDYSAAIADSQDEATIDPILVALPGTRKTVDGGWTSYFTRSTLWGKKEIARTMGNVVAIRSGHDEHIRAGLLLAKERCELPLEFRSKSPVFVEKCERIARELGIPTKTFTPVSDENLIVGAEKPPTTETEMPAPAEPAHPTAAPAEPTRSTVDPLIEMAKHKEKLLDYREPLEPTSIIGVMQREAVIDGQAYAVIKTDAGSILVRLENLTNITPGEPIEATIGTENTVLTAVEQPKVNVDGIAADETIDTSAQPAAMQESEPANAQVATERATRPDRPPRRRRKKTSA